MKLIQFENETVKLILEVREDTTLENIAIVENIPAFEHKDGFGGVLKYNAEHSLYWEYVENTGEESETEYGISEETYNKIIDDYTLSLIEEGVL